MLMFSKFTTVFMAACAVATGASAATIDVDVYGGGQLSQFQSDYGAALGAGTFIGEDFETLGPEGSASVEGVVGSPFATSVGTFEEIGGIGSGGTVRQLGLTQSSQLALRDGNVYGRQNTWPIGGSWFLDSNDTWGFSWTITEDAVGSQFDQVMFSLTDGSDSGAFLRIALDDGTTYEQRDAGSGRLGNGNIALVVVDFGEAVSSATITVGNFSSNADGAGWRINDGVGIDGAAVNVVPVPASLGFLLAGLGALGVMRRRQS
jgi:hypothetical protein